MIGGAAYCVNMLMYLIERGAINEAAASNRKGLEYLGMAAHLDGESPEFKRAFISGGVTQKPFSDNDIRYRFAGMSERMAKAATTLYSIISEFHVHGGTMKSMIEIAIEPTQHSCAFQNRSIESTAKYLALFKPITEITAIEVAHMAGDMAISQNE